MRKQLVLAKPSGKVSDKDFGIKNKKRLHYLIMRFNVSCSMFERQKEKGFNYEL